MILLPVFARSGQGAPASCQIGAVQRGCTYVPRRKAHESVDFHICSWKNPFVVKRSAGDQGNRVGVSYIRRAWPRESCCGDADPGLGVCLLSLCFCRWDWPQFSVTGRGPIPFGAGSRLSASGFQMFDLQCMSVMVSLNMVGSSREHADGQES